MKKMKAVVRVEFEFIYAEGYGEVLEQARTAFEDGEIELIDVDVDPDTVEEMWEAEEPDGMTQAKDRAVG